MLLYFISANITRESSNYQINNYINQHICMLLYISPSVNGYETIPCLRTHHLSLVTNTDAALSKCFSTTFPEKSFLLPLKWQVNAIQRYQQQQKGDLCLKSMVLHKLPRETKLHSVRKAPGSISLQSTNNDHFLLIEIPVQIITISIRTLYEISEIKEHVIP